MPRFAMALPSTYYIKSYQHHTSMPIGNKSREYTLPNYLLRSTTTNAVYSVFKLAAENCH